MYVSIFNRRQDGGTFMVDHDLFSYVMIPPGSQNFKIPMQCSSECTSVMFPREGVDVFAIHSHTHISGKKIFVLGKNVCQKVV